jgi:hypothetical protein
MNWGSLGKALCSENNGGFTSPWKRNCNSHSLVRRVLATGSCLPQVLTVQSSPHSPLSAVQGFRPQCHLCLGIYIIKSLAKIPASLVRILRTWKMFRPESANRALCRNTIRPTTIHYPLHPLKSSRTSAGINWAFCPECI